MAARLAVVAVLGLGVLAGCGGDDSGSTADGGASGSGASTASSAASGVDAPEGIEGVVLERAASAAHTNASVEYEGRPPTGGDHNPTPVPCRFYDAELPDENAVHSLEHGAVWIAYDPATSAGDVATIKALVADNRKVFASPYTDMGSPIVLAAWERRLALDSVEDDRVQAFIDEYVAAASAPEPNVPC